MSKSTFSFDINCSNASISPNNNRTVTVTIDECEKQDILELATDTHDVSDIVSHLGEDKVLDSIGIEYVKNYFNLTENE